MTGGGQMGKEPEAIARMHRAFGFATGMCMDCSWPQNVSIARDPGRHPIRKGQIAHELRRLHHPGRTAVQKWNPRWLACGQIARREVLDCGENSASDRD